VRSPLRRGGDVQPRATADLPEPEPLVEAERSVRVVPNVEADAGPVRFGGSDHGGDERRAEALAPVLRHDEDAADDPETR
jgi:hypothetical protein